MTAEELIALDPADLRDLLDAAPGDLVAVKAAALGLDLTIPAHCSAMRDAGYLPPVGTAPMARIEHMYTQVTGGVKAPLTPNEQPGPDGHTGEGGPPEDSQSGSQPVEDLAELLSIYRGSPHPFLAGTFALYSAPSGAVVMVTEIPGRGIEEREIPRKIVGLATSAMSGRGPLGKFFGRG